MATARDTNVLVLTASCVFISMHAALTAQSLGADGREIQSKRTAASRTIALGDGSLTCNLYPRPIHYRDVDGSFKPIETTVETLNEASAPLTLGVLTNTLPVRFHGERAMVHAGDQQLGITFAPLSLGMRMGDSYEALFAAQDAPPVADGNRVVYRGAIGGLDLSYEVRPSGLAQEIRLESAKFLAGRGAGLRTSDLVLYESLELLNCATYRFDAHGRIEIRRAGTQEFLLVNVPEAWEVADVAGGRASSVRGTLEVRELEGGALQIASVFPAAWFTAPKRKFPVIIDPDLILMPGSAIGKDSQIVDTMAGSNYGTRLYLTDNWGSPNAQGMVEFDITPIPLGAVVNTGTLTVWHGSNNEANTFGAHENQAAWDELTVTWSNAPAFVATPAATVPPQGPSMDMIYDVTVSVSNMVAGTIPNHGWRLRSQGGDNDAYLHSSDHSVMGDWPELRVNYTPGGVNILSIDAPDTMVIAGLGGYAVSMIAENIGPNIVDITSSGLTFFGTADRTAEYTVIPDPGNPTTIPAMGMQTLNFTVDVDLAATAELVTIDGTIATSDLTFMAMFMDTTAVTTDTWNVITCFAPLCGDCNGDLVLSILDALVAAQHSAVLITLTGQDFSNCNVIGTLEPFPGAVVDILDALTLAQAAAGLPVALMCC